MFTLTPDNIFNIQDDQFGNLAMDVFHFQYENNPLYRRYADLLGRDPSFVTEIGRIPFLPIGFFKTHDIQTTSFEPEVVFESSGTTRTGNSHHLVKSAELYRNDFLKGFDKFYGEVNQWCIIGLLPSYLERSSSSLVAMVDELIRLSGHPRSGFYLYEYEKLHDLLLTLEKQGQKTLLIGVTFALLDFAERFPMQLNHTIVMETGGMKGRRKELTRKELHDILQSRLGLSAIHSEYGMTEMMSQAYSSGGGIFRCVPWMRVLVRNEDDPLEILQKGSGIINVIDLGNLYSCAFIATEDAGYLHENGSFEVSGRIDNSDIRGCSLLVM